MVRLAAFSAATFWLTPVLAVGLKAFHVPGIIAVVLGFCAAVAIVAAVSSPVAALMGHESVGRWCRIAAVVFALAASLQIARLSVYMADAGRPWFSCSPNDPFRVRHSCMTSYAEAARFAVQGGRNVYDASLFQPRQLGPLTVDSYHYPPPFLLAPMAVNSVTTSFFHARALWFALQALFIAGSLLVVARWLGGAAGAAVLAGGALMLSMKPVLFALQQGNFQVTAVLLALVGFTMTLGRRPRGGALLLTCAAAAKVFPGILCAYLLAARRWRILIWSAVFGVALIAATAAIVGTRPFADFFAYELPMIEDGRAFPHAERPQNAAANLSVYGQTVRLRLLGFSALDTHTGLAIASAYGIFVIALALVAGWAGRLDPTSPHGRLRALQAGLALVTLASFRSPFVGNSYGCVSTLLLIALIAAERPHPRYQAAWWAALVALAMGIWLTPSPSHQPTPFTLTFSAALFLGALGLNIWALARAALIVPAEAALRTAPSTAVAAIDPR